ncbi:MAG: flagellar hook-associated protein FlgL [Nitrospirae bacterium]|nr:flagellar hook-associated protein FlgL [Nitrospirota bacterium]
MRISSFMMYQQTQQSFESNFTKLFNAQEQLATGLKINRPSDDPVGIRKALDYKVTISSNEQYQRNMGDATSFLDATDTAMSSVINNLQRLKEITLEAVNGANGPTDRVDIAQEVGVIKDALFALSNSKYTNQSLFSGFKLNTASFASSGSFTYVMSGVSGASGVLQNGNNVTGTGSYLYQGDNNVTHVNVGTTSNVIRNVSGTDAFAYTLPTIQTIRLGSGNFAHYIPTVSASDPSVNTSTTFVVLSTSSDPSAAGYESAAYSNYMDIAADIGSALNNNDVDMATALMKSVDSAIDKATTVRSAVGARQNFITGVNGNTDSITAFSQELLSNVQDADMTQSVTAFSQGEVALQALRQSSSQILSQSLLDFIK